MMFVQIPLSKSQCSSTSCNQSSGICLEDPVQNGYQFSIDVTSAGLDGSYVSVVDIRVSYNNTSNITVNTALTTASLFSGVPAPFTLSYSSGQVRLSGNVSGQFCDGEQFVLNPTGLLFTIYFTGTPGECFDFEINTAGIVFDNNNGTFSICNATIAPMCEYEYCIPSVLIGGLIESYPPLECDGSSDHGVPDVVVPIFDPSMFTVLVGCIAMTDNHGDYSCEVIQGGDYRIQPSKSDNDSCGVTSLDIAIIRNHILGSNCSVMTANWQFIAADANQSGTISTLDMVQIQKIILGDPHTVPSWRFVPTTTYALMPSPSGCQTSVPSFNPYIDLNKVNSNSLYNDFIGVKMGDVNGSCTNCNGESFQLSAPATITVKEISDGLWEFSSDKLIQNLAVWEVGLDISEAGDREIELTTDLPGKFSYRREHNRVMIHYYNLIPGGETAMPETPLFLLSLNSKAALPVIESGIFMEEDYTLSEIRMGELLPRAFGHQPSEQLNQVYPNPAMNGEIFFNFTKSKAGWMRMAFYNAHGVLCLEEYFLQNTSANNRVDVSRLAPGMYVWQANDSAGMLQQGKVVIQ